MVKLKKLCGGSDENQNQLSSAKLSKSSQWYTLLVLIDIHLGDHLLGCLQLGLRLF